MKRFISIFVVATLFFAACTKENFEPPKSIENLELATAKAQNLGKFEKELTIYDELKENNVVLKLWAMDESILNEWQEDDFEIFAILKNESFDDAYEKKYPISYVEYERKNESQIDEEFEKVTEPLFSVMILEKNMQKGVENIALTILNKGSETKWDYPPALYSSEQQRNRTATIRGYKWLWRAYYGVDIKAEINAFWTVKVAQWQQIKSGETHNVNSYCYQMRVWQKYNNSSAITVAFDD